MSDYAPETCAFCNILPTWTCDSCSRKICFNHRAGFWPAGDGGQVDYCTTCLTTTNAPGALR